MHNIKLGLALVMTALFSLSATAFAADDLTIRNESSHIARVYLYTLHEQLVSSATVPYVTTARLRSKKGGTTAKLIKVYLYEGMSGGKALCSMSELIRPGDLDWEITATPHIRKNSDCSLHRL
jgi:hypothetical protein